MPQVERTDYLFNANDSFWIPNADHPLAGDYSPLHGAQNTARSLRTRENAAVLRDTSPTGPAGADGKFSLDELATAALQNRGYSSRVLKDDVVARCQGQANVDVAALPNDNPDLSLPAGTVDVSQRAPPSGPGTAPTTSTPGRPLWREFMGRFDPRTSPGSARCGRNRSTPPSRSTRPPRLPRPPPAAPTRCSSTWPRRADLRQGGPARRRRPLGDLQYADRNGERIPIHGGNAVDGTTNVVGYNPSPGSTTETIPKRSPVVAGRTSLTKDGYMVNNGSSFMMVVDFGATGGDGPKAKVLLNYGDSQDRSNPVFVDSTRRFSERTGATSSSARTRSRPPMACRLDGQQPAMTGAG